MGLATKWLERAWGSGLRLSAFLAAVAAIVLVFVGQAVAYEEGSHTATVEFAGAGSGSVASVSAGYVGYPPIDCHWNGAETDVGTSPAEGSGVAGLHECNDRLARNGSREAEIFEAVADPGSEFVEWQIVEGYNPHPGTTADYAVCLPRGEQVSVREEAWIETAGGRVCMAGSESSFEVGPTEDVRVKPVFEPESASAPLQFRIDEGEGTVVSSRAGLECSGPAGTECEADFPQGIDVTLTASPAAGYRFGGWVGCPPDGADGHRCTIRTKAAGPVEIGVLFEKTWQLSITMPAGSEPGFVMVEPVGAACLYKCTSADYSFAEGTKVQLSAYQPSGHLGKRRFLEFRGGTGDAAVCNGTVKCSFTVTDTDSSIEALFGEGPAHTLNLEKEGDGLAFIRSYNGIYCSEYCSRAAASHLASEEVTVYWRLAPGTTSIDWGEGVGTCFGRNEAVEGTCKVKVTSNKWLVATLE